ncbi:GyrI-like domain-containing protein [Halobacillus litoralis]|uniref:GyrI-like domain-containing protein n=1 Tax=Halobacillus litoralis TaxID=45668 RepID=UPI001CD4A740|nr:GyrI-like domain-containing protein [Halobacillus litoralis]MCA1022906.1 GyrI-like domain-containing protein [Halobacillus litoralis]
MEPQIVQLGNMYLMGESRRMTLTGDKTVELWRSFKPKVKTIQGQKDGYFYNLSIYPEGFDLNTFTSDTRFTRWAAVHVHADEELREGLESFLLHGGLYAVFIHKGPAHNFVQTLDKIFNEWLPNSSYELDARPHFERMGPDYRVDDLNAEEEVWIPIK